MNYHYNVVGAVLYTTPDIPNQFEFITILAKSDEYCNFPKAKNLEQAISMIKDREDPLPDTPDAEGFYRDIFKNIPRTSRREITLYPTGQLSFNDKELKETLKSLSEDFTIRIISPYPEVRKILKEYCE